jgi:acyl-CoA reductase-like NAD-dependent aldehyde dehydrogenase
VRDISDGTRLVDEEQFGPVRPVVRVSDAQDTVKRANASMYGLGASVWTGNVQRGLAVADELDAGMVWINKHFDILPHLPLSGFKQSGLGAEFGTESLREMTQLRVINGPGVAA